MSGTEMLRFMATRPAVRNREEYFTARKILEYNQSEGSLTGYDCPICKNKGDVMDLDESGNEVFRVCKCARIREVQANARKSGLGDLLSKRFSNYIAEEDWQKAALHKAMTFAKNGGNRWFAMLGQSGAGKTHLCAAVSNQLLGKGRQVVYMLWTMEIRRLKRLAAESEYDKIFDRYKLADVLYIDDLFKGKITDADVTAAFELINYRYNNPQLTTIISSELSLDDISRIDGAIAGRIRERCGDFFITIAPDNKKNWRLK